MANYVTNTGFVCPDMDAAEEGDVLMINDYIGTWHAGFEQGPAWRALTEAHPGRVFVPSEFGLCEPAFPGGDPARIRIFEEKMAFYRSCPQIAGTICFCLNDYRTHMGEEGEGRFRRRVHGSLTLEGKEKPSCAVIRQSYAPLRLKWTEKGLRVTAADSIPSYTVRGYVLFFGDERWERWDIPDLRPGESAVLGDADSPRSVRITRENGDPVAEWTETELD